MTRKGATLPESDGTPAPAGVETLRVPPHSMEAEQSVLGALLMDPACFALVSDALTPDDFFRHEHKVIFGAIADLSAESKAVDIITVFDLLRDRSQIEQTGGLSYLNELAQSVPSSRNARRYAEIVAERATLRAIIKASDEIATAAFAARGKPASTVLDEAKGAIARLQEARRFGGARRVPLLGLDELRQAAEGISWMVKRVIPADSVGMLFGASGTFKSFVALDMALHVCHGLPWMGRKTRKGPVLYIAAEGGAGLWARIIAWHKARSLDWRTAQLYVVPAAIDLGQDAWRVVDAAQAVGVVPMLCIVDTLSQTYSGEENSANEMAAYLREIGARFRALWHCAVLLIHHSGHSATERPRGSSAIRANLDFMLGAFRDEKEMLATVTCAKQKDGEAIEDATFSMVPVQIGTDEDGDRVMSLMARHLSSAEDLEHAMATEAKSGRGGKNHLLLSLLQNGMQEDSLRKAFYEDCGLEGADSRRQAYFRAKAWATKAGFFEVAQGIVIVTKAKG